MSESGKGSYPPAPCVLRALLKLYWALCAGLLLVVIQLGCQWQQKVASSTPRIQTSLVEGDTDQEPAKHPEPNNPSFDHVQTWVREDEPAIEITGPVFADPYQDWAPPAVLERLPAARAELVSSSVPRAELVRLPQ
jgi:hypothetical protein